MIDPVVDPVAADPSRPEAGEWVEGDVAGRKAIVFDPVAGGPVFAMFCDTRDGLVLERRRLLPSGPHRMMEIAFGDARESLATNEVSNNGPVLRAQLPFNSELFTRLRDFEGAISITVGRSQPLVLPADPLIPELVRKCITGATAGA
ncbi:hypothetical protein [Sphingosinicella rhizophila]|uniref:Uncharacterized protein n=1 Tax=Sphingosinicella rhizophila TaxID=3050082 RepID=A0ABU3QAI3_9SPHN|nr:hypothetical protein [Sphingosinicella sp. GR2756]MDT9600139.1 hypothetical protein [Sphingosinicella sp. GR2756]